MSTIKSVVLNIAGLKLDHVDLSSVEFRSSYYELDPENPRTCSTVSFSPVSIKRSQEIERKLRAKYRENYEFLVRKTFRTEHNDKRPIYKVIVKSGYLGASNPQTVNIL